MRLKVFNCDHPVRPHGEVTACDCKPGACPDYAVSQDGDAPAVAVDVPPPAARQSPLNVRHLAYVVYPRSDNHWWRLNLDHLKLRWRLFNGSKHVAVITDDTTDTADAVKEYLHDDSVRYLEFANDTGLREVVAHGPLFSAVLGSGGDAPGHAVLFAHAKGVTRPYGPSSPICHWVDMLYSSLLDYWPVVGDVLYDRPLAGSFKKVGAGFTGSESLWHYSGSFFWARGADLFSRDWRRIDREWWGIEAWPSLHFTEPEAGVVFKHDEVRRLNLYSQREVERRFLPEWKAWVKRHERHRTPAQLFA